MLELLSLQLPIWSHVITFALGVAAYYAFSLSKCSEEVKVDGMRVHQGPIDEDMVTSDLSSIEVVHALLIVRGGKTAAN